jgi:two-component sensor histidine kinase
VHESLYGSENLETINLAEYARDLTNDILSSHGSPVPVRLAIKLERVMMSVDRAILCGLILNELLSNAIKHAFPEGGGQIGVSLRCTPEGQCKLCVEDNGVGIPADLDIKTTKSMGLRLVRSLTRQLRGTIDLRRTDQGTTGCLEFTVE